MGEGDNVSFFPFVSLHYIYKFWLLAVVISSSLLFKCILLKEKVENIGCLSWAFHLLHISYFGSGKNTFWVQYSCRHPHPTPKKRKSMKLIINCVGMLCLILPFCAWARHPGTATLLDIFVWIWIMYFSFTFTLILQYVRGIKRWWDVQTQRLEMRSFL